MLIQIPALIFWPSSGVFELDHGPTHDGPGDAYTYEVSNTDPNVIQRHVEHHLFAQLPEGSSRASKLTLIGTGPTKRADAIAALNSSVKSYAHRVCKRRAVSGAGLPTTSGGELFEVKNGSGAVIGRGLRTGSTPDWSVDQTCTEYWLATDALQVGDDYTITHVGSSTVDPWTFGENKSSSPTHLKGATLLFEIDVTYLGHSPSASEIPFDPT